MVYWQEYSESYSQGPYCDEPTDMCWNDVNTQNTEGYSTQWEFDCQCDLEASAPRRPAGSPSKRRPK